jgi:hypothetical protein
MTPRRGEGGNPNILTARFDKSLKDKEHKEKKKRNNRENDKVRPQKKLEPEAKG